MVVAALFGKCDSIASQIEALFCQRRMVLQNGYCQAFLHRIHNSRQRLIIDGDGQFVEEFWECAAGCICRCCSNRPGMFRIARFEDTDLQVFTLWFFGDHDETNRMQ